MQTIELVLHDWRNMPREERARALADIRELAESHASDHRRARALRVVASFFHFLTEEPRRPDVDVSGDLIVRPPGPSWVCKCGASGEGLLWEHFKQSPACDPVKNRGDPSV